MNKDQIEMAKVFSEVLTHIRQQFDTYRETEDPSFAIISAFESGEAMLATRIQAADFTNAEEQFIEDREATVKAWARRFELDCADFHYRYSLPTRIKNILLRMAKLTRSWEVWTTTVDGRKFELIEVPLQARIFKGDLPVDKYPEFIDIVQEIVSGERPVAQIGDTYKYYLEKALLKENRRVGNGTDD